MSHSYYDDELNNSEAMSTPKGSDFRNNHEVESKTLEVDMQEESETSKDYTRPNSKPGVDTEEEWQRSANGSSEMAVSKPTTV